MALRYGDMEINGMLRISGVRLRNLSSNMERQVEESRGGKYRNNHKGKPKPSYLSRIPLRGKSWRLE
jgi:hypothetical protein